MTLHPAMKRKAERERMSRETFHKGDRVWHVHHGIGTVARVKTTPEGTAVWIKVDSDGIEGTVAPEFLRKLPKETGP